MAANTTLSHNQLLGYLKAVKDLEVLKYMQLSAIETLESNIYRCNSIINSRDYAYVQAEEKRKYHTDSDFKTTTFWWICMVGLFGAGLGLSFTAEKVRGGQFLSALFLDFGEMFKGALKGFLLSSILVLLVAYFIDRINKIKKEKRYYQEHQAAKYEASCTNRKISQQNTELEQRRQLARKQIDIYNKQIYKINRDLERIKTLLTNYYRCNVIYPKYRNNLVYICSLYEYFDSQRCNTLVGPNGAYNLLEADIKFGVIVERLDQINCKLD